VWASPAGISETECWYWLAPSCPYRVTSRVSSFVVTILLMTLVVVVATAFFVPILLAVVRHVGIAIPVVPHEVDRLAAGVVLSAMLAPVPLMAWRHMQVQRLAHFAARRPLDDHRALVDQLRLGKAANVQASIETGFANVDRDAQVAGQQWRSAGAAERGRSNEP